MCAAADIFQLHNALIKIKIKKKKEEERKEKGTVDFFFKKPPPVSQELMFDFYIHVAHAYLPPKTS